MYERRRGEDMYDIIKIQIKNKIQISKIIVRARGGQDSRCAYMYAYMQKVGGRK